MISRRTPVTIALLLAIAAMWTLEVRVHADVDDDVLIALGANVPWRALHHQYSRFFTAMFLHGGQLHLVANALTLFQLGALYENLFGSVRFTALYFISGLIASAVSSAAGQVSVGASGALFGVAGALVVSIVRAPRYWQTRWLRSVVAQLALLIPANLIVAAFFPVVDNRAHIAGLITGLFFGIYVPLGVPPPPPSEQTIEVRAYDDGGF